MKSWIESAFADEPSDTPPTKIRKTATARKKTTPQISNSISNTKSSSSTAINSTNKTTSTKLPPLLSKIINNQSSQEQSINSNKKTPITKLPLTVKYEPKKRIDLVVHKSKIEQLNSLIDQITSKQNGSILIIEGPPGCGKNVISLRLKLKKSLNLFY